MDNTNLVGSNERPIPLQQRPDLEVAAISYLGVGYRVIKDPVGLRYHRLQIEQYRVLELLNGERSLKQIRDELRQDFPAMNMTFRNLQQHITDLYQKGLVHINRSGQGASIVKQRGKKRKEKLKTVLRSFLSIRLPGWDPELSLQRMYPWFKWMFHPLVIMVSSLFMVSSLVLLAVQFDHFRSSLPEFQQFFGWPNLMYLWLAFGLTKVVHEFGHGLTCKHFGGECHEMGMMLLIFSPCLYCDVTNSWMLRNKWHRIWIAAAGMYIEVLLSAVAICVWWNSTSRLLHHLTLNVFFVTGVTTVIWNINPLMRFDGYYILSDLLEIPNLRQKANEQLRQWFGRYCLGIELKPGTFMPETGRSWFVLFAVASWLYRWIILFSISLFLYTVLKPYDLQSIGVTALVAMLAGGIFSTIRKFYQMTAAPRTEPMSRRKIACTLTILGSVTFAGLTIPIPWHIEAPFVTQPEGVVHVHVTTPGQLMTTKQLKNPEDPSDEMPAVAQFVPAGTYRRRVKPGDFVQKGDVLAVVENIEKPDLLRERRVQKDIKRTQIRMYELLEDAPDRQYAEAEPARINEEIQVVEEQLAHRIIRAPISGTVLAPPRVPAPRLDDTTRTQLGTWYGTPLDDRHRHCFLQTGDHLLSIAPTDTMEAVIYIDQGDRNDVSDRDEVELRLEKDAKTVEPCNVSKTSPRCDAFAPESITTKSGGQLPTVAEADGRETLVSPTYLATATLGSDVHLMRTGMRGLARVVVDERTAGEWLWRSMRRTFHFFL